MPNLMSLSATRRFTGSRCSAIQTSPKPPSPIFSSNLYSGHHVLNRCDLSGHERDFMLVDLSRVFTMDVGVIRELARGHAPRLRLLPPDLEHFSQAFAWLLMWVGLPVDIPPFR